MKNPFNQYSKEQLSRAAKHIADIKWRKRKYGYLPLFTDSDIKERERQIKEALELKQ